MKHTDKRWSGILLGLALLLMPLLICPAQTEAAISIQDALSASVYQYNLVERMEQTPNRTGTWVADSNGYRFKLATNQYLKNEWARINGKIYCFDENGYRRVGFYTYRNRQYYLKSNGQLAVDYWLTNGLRKCYLKPDGTLTIGFLEYGGEWYYFSERGLMVRGWRLINGTLYYFRDDGTRASGWEMIEDSGDQKTYRHYFTSEGVPLTGWNVIDGKQYYLSNRGRVTVGWKNVRDDYWYYFEEDGAGAVGWKQIDGEWYCFSNEGIMLTNQWVDGYYLGSDGKRQNDTPSEQKHYVFCGDSRTILMEQTIQNEEHTYIAKSRQGYLWFRSTGAGELQKCLSENPFSTVILNFGVNDVVNCSKYIAFYKELFKMYPMARFYIVSVNPVDDVNYPDIKERHKSTEEIEEFNQKMKEAFPMRYLDCYSYLQTIGFETTDGVHYTEDTYWDIYNYIIRETA